MFQEHCNQKEIALQIQKRDRIITVAKLVTARPLGEIVLAVPYRNRRTVETLSLPIAVLNYAQAHGAKCWIVRFDLEGSCYSIPLDHVQTAGWLKASHGIPEFFVPLDEFQLIEWQDWPFVKRSIVIKADTTKRHQNTESTRLESQQLRFVLQ